MEIQDRLDIAESLFGSVPSTMTLEESLLPDEVAAIEQANKSILENGTMEHEEIDWD